MVITYEELERFLIARQPQYGVVFTESGEVANAAQAGTIASGIDRDGDIVEYDDVIADIEAWRNL